MCNPSDNINYEICLTRSFAMKSLASAETSLNASSSKSYLAIVTLAIVSTSVSPMNGDSPESLCNSIQIIQLYANQNNNARSIFITKLEHQGLIFFSVKQKLCPP